MVGRLFKRRSTWVTLLGFSMLWFSYTAFAQESHGGEPFARYMEVPALKPGDNTWQGEPLDVRRYQKEDSLLRNAKDIPFRFGIEREVHLDLVNNGQWVNTESGQYLRYLVSSPGANTLSLVFEQFVLPKGVQVFVSEYDFGHWIGSLDYRNNLPDQLLGTVPQAGDKLWIEVLVPHGVQMPKLKLESVVHGYRDIKAGLAFGDAGNCHFNVVCPEGDAWREQIRAVGILLNRGSFCTGSMINNVRRDGRPFMLTANHCGTPNGAWSIAFNYESTVCTPSVEPSWRLSQSVSVLTRRASSPRSDFQLTELIARPPISYNVYYSGWDRRDISPQSGVGIHHPAGDLKKISPYANPAPSSTYSNAQCWNPTWTSGAVTEGGSSGSPLFNQDKRVVGQLYGGPSVCGALPGNLNDHYGKFSVSWSVATNPTNANQLQPWLDPDNTGAEVIDGLDPNCPDANPPSLVGNRFDSSTLLPSKWQTGIVVNRNWVVVAGKSAYATTGNCVSVINNATTPIGRPAILQLPLANLTNTRNMQLVFDWAYQARNNNFDTLDIEISTNCGQSFDLLYRFNLPTVPVGGQLANFPQPSHWKTDSVRIPDFLINNDKVSFRLVAKSNRNANIFVDNIELRPVFFGPPKPQAYLSPIACTGAVLNLKGIYENVHESYRWRIPQLGFDQTQVIPFEPSITFNTVARYAVILTVTSNGIEGSDTAFVNVVPAFTKPFPEVQSFRGGSLISEGYVVRPNRQADPTWEVKTTIQGQTLYKPLLVKDNLTSSQIGAEDSLVMPAVEFRGVYRPRLAIKYAYRYDLPAANPNVADSIIIYLTRNCGHSYEKLTSIGGANMATTGQSQGLFNPRQQDFRWLFVNLDDQMFFPAPPFIDQEVYSAPKFVIVSKSAGGNLLYIDTVRVDTVPSCPQLPVVFGSTSCANQPLVLSVSEREPGATYFWYTADNRLLGVDPVVVPIDSVKPPIYYRVAAVKNGCQSDLIEYFPNRTIPPIAGNLITYRNELGELVVEWVAPGGRLNYQWYRDSVEILDQPSAMFIPTESGAYRVVVTDVLGCVSQTNSIRVDLANINRVRAYPNPATSEVTIVVNAAENQTGELVLLDAIGRTVMKETLTIGKGFVVRQWDMSIVPKGAYVVSFQSNLQVPIKTLLIKR